MTLGWLAKRLGWGKRISPKRLPVVECNTLDISNVRITVEVRDERVCLDCRMSCATYDGSGARLQVLGRDWFELEQLRNATKADFARLVRHLAITMLTHELDEHLRVDGERMFNPHRNEADDA